MPFITKTSKLLVMGLMAALTLSAQAAKGDKDLAPPTPSVTEVTYLVPGTTTDITIGGVVTSNEAYIEKAGKTFISGSFSGSGISINSITVNSPTSLTLNITVADFDPLNPFLGTSTLTITNPSSLSATSVMDVIHVTDVPVITATQFSPDPASVVDDITATVTALTNHDTSLAVSYSYQWFEDGVAISESSSTLPASATQQGSNYYCDITPSKVGTIIGATFSTTAIVVTADKDGNGIHDQWEVDVVMEAATDPDADIDGDGLSAREEYLFGLDPNDAQSRQAIVKCLDPVSGEFQYSRAVNKIDGINYKVWTSPDLVNWTEQVGASQSLSNANANSEVVTVGFTPALINANPRLFVRVSAE